MNPKHRPLLALLVLVFVSLACRTYIQNSKSDFKTKDGVIISCVQYRDYTEVMVGPIGYECEISCPNGDVGKFDPPNSLINDQSKSISISSKELQDQVCQPSVAPAAAEATEPPTEEAPTEEPTEAPTDEAPTEPPLQPYLTGSATACDLTKRFINFSIAENAPAVEPSSLNVTLDGQPLKCSTPESNPGILTCTFAPEASFPAQVSLSIDGVEVNNFSFDGSICAFSDPPSTEEPSTEEAPPTTDPCAGVLTPTPSCP